jgi:malic enzyme
MLFEHSPPNPDNMDNLFRKDAFIYHSEGRPGKIEVVPTKPYSTQRDLSLAYTPGVADPCLAIKDNLMTTVQNTPPRASGRSYLQWHSCPGSVAT